MSHLRFIVFLSFALLLALPATALDYGGSTRFTRYDHYPSPAPFAYSVLGAATPDGRLLLWDGDSLYRQRGPNMDRFVPIAQGYTGDPGFLALAPDGHSAVLGAGFSGDLYRFDAYAPVDFSPAAVIGNIAHYSGTFLNDTLLLIDAGKADWSGSELVIFDLDGGKSLPVPVVVKPSWPAEKQQVVDKPIGSYSCAMTVAPGQGVVYVMDGNLRELRSFSVAALIDAYRNGLTLDWDTDGTPIGQPGDYFGGGVSGITPEGYLVIGGSEGLDPETWMPLPGGIQIVDPASGALVAFLDPTGTAPYTTVTYNPYTHVITVAADGMTYANTPFQGLPAASAAGLILLTLALGCFMRRRIAG
jgi:hypothetical protein